jgi:hypothetical protein
MPFALVIIGLIMFVAGVRDTQAALYSQLTKDFTGTGNFFYWIAALLIVGAVGYIPAMRAVSRVFLGLILLVLFLANGGIWAQLQAALAAPVSTAPTAGSGASTPAGIAAATGAQTNASQTILGGLLSGLGFGAANQVGANIGNAISGAPANAPATVPTGTGVAGATGGTSNDITIYGSQPYSSAAH